MTTELQMPQLGESVTEGTLGRWLKRPGDPVTKYEPLLEVVTDKVDTEVPSPVTGTLLEILVPEGETVRVGTVIARIGTAETVATADTAPQQPAPPVTAAASSSPPATVPTSENGLSAQHAFLSPVVARLVAEHGLDPQAIAGTGQGGRVTKQDVLRFVAAKEAASPSQPLQPLGNTAAVEAETDPASRQTPLPTGMLAEHQVPALPEDTEIVPLTPMRRVIAEHMERSVRTVPHVTTVVEVDMGAVLAHREAHRAAFERQGVRLTITPYLVQAVVAGLEQVPVLNGSFSDQGITLNQRMHIGIAVALDEGLLVPVVRDADEKNLLGLARAVGDLAGRARSRRLQPDETQGGTFTITNHGVTGSLFATPIINLPQAAILGAGAIVKRPVVVSHEGIEAIAIRPICYLSLTFDHRIADGATADKFLAVVRTALERGYDT